MIFIISHSLSLSLSHTYSLLGAAALLEDGIFPKMVEERYASYDSGFGKKLAEGKVTMEECEKYIHEHGAPKQISGKQEKFQSIFNTYT